MKLLRCEFIVRSDGNLSIAVQYSGQQTIVHKGERVWLDVPAEQVYTLMTPQPASPTVQCRYCGEHILRNLLLCPKCDKIQG